MNQRRESSAQFFLGTRLGALVALLSLHAAVAASPQVQTPWQLIPPSGRDPIGTVTLHLIDRLRWDPIAPTRRWRQLMVQLWYPASPARAAGGAQYMEAGVAHVLDRDLSMPPGTFEAVRTLARVGAAVASAPRPFPVVVYSPGNGSWRNASTALVEELVSHGFIVVTIDHPYDGEAVEFPDGTIALAQPLRQPNPALSNPLAQWDASVEPRLIVRVADVRFVLDALAALNAGRNPDAEHRPLPAHLAGALDLSRTGIFGHSLGAATTIEVMREDQRVRVGFMMDGPVPRVARNTRFDRPIILVRSDNAAIGELVGPSWRYFAPGLRGWHRAVLIAGSNHNDLTDLGLVARHLRLSPALRTSLLLGTIDARRVVALQRSYLTVFFNLQLCARR
jgi:hypothetical protein